jgi:hypothetical protein
VTRQRWRKNHSFEQKSRPFLGGGAAAWGNKKTRFLEKKPNLWQKLPKIWKKSPETRKSCADVWEIFPRSRKFLHYRGNFSQVLGFFCLSCWGFHDWCWHAIMMALNTAIAEINSSLLG